MKRCRCSVVEKQRAKKLRDVRAERCKTRIEDVLLDKWNGLVLITCFIQFKLLRRGGKQKFGLFQAEAAAKHGSKCLNPLVVLKAEADGMAVAVASNRQSQNPRVLGADLPHAKDANGHGC